LASQDQKGQGPSTGNGAAYLVTVSFAIGLVQLWSALMCLGFDARAVASELPAESPWVDEDWPIYGRSPPESGEGGRDTVGAASGPVSPDGDRIFSPSFFFGVVEQRAPFAPPVKGSLRQWLYSFESELAFVWYRGSWMQWEWIARGGVAFPTRIREGLGRQLSQYSGHLGLRMVGVSHVFGSSVSGWQGAWKMDVTAGRHVMQYPRHRLGTFEPALRLAYHLTAPSVSSGASDWLPWIELSGRYSGWVSTYDGDEIRPIDESDGAFLNQGELRWSDSGAVSMWSVEVRLAAAQRAVLADGAALSGNQIAHMHRSVQHHFGLFANYSEVCYDDLIASEVHGRSAAVFRESISVGVFWLAE
jgi:hypothetical protein